MNMGDQENRKNYTQLSLNRTVNTGVRKSRDKK